MAHFVFKQNPKQRAESRAQAAYGRQAKVKVIGRRMTVDECHAAGYVVNSYLVACTVDGKEVATAHNVDWRKAYKMLTELMTPGSATSSLPKVQPASTT